MIFILSSVLQMHQLHKYSTVELFVVQFWKITQKSSANLQFIVLDASKTVFEALCLGYVQFHIGTDQII